MDQQITSVRIHPAIGIARVGNSTGDVFVGPESPDEPPKPAGFYKDQAGAIRRQAARFRLYGYNREGQAVRELRPGRDGVAEIEWTVHLANRKPAWYRFSLALDIPEAKLLKPDQYGRRNADVPPPDRGRLVNDPGPRTVRGSLPERQSFDTGTVMGVHVPLGDIASLGDGRLLVAGGHGRSGSWQNQPVTTFANNDTWYDDTSDGPVTAVATVNGTRLTADPAWVVVAPPHYAPAVRGVRTLYDLLVDVFVQNGWLTLPERVSFADDVEPLLGRICGLQWVNHGFATQFGWTGPNDFLAPALRRRLADPAAQQMELRQQVYLAMRTYLRDGGSPEPWPWIYGDAMSIPQHSERQHLELTRTQMWLLEQWVVGKFDPRPLRRRYPVVDEAPVAEQPGLLDEAALVHCAADAFHPGCEVTWPIRHDTLFAAPFRIRHRPADEPEPDYGDRLTPDVALSAHGPLHAQGPGGLTRWMAVPWQTDTASCRSGYESAAGLGPRYSPYLPTFWPAQVPNHVLTAENFAVVNSSADDAERARRFEERAVWLRGLTGTKVEQINQMVHDWWKLGIVEARPYTVGDGRFPPVVLVESAPEAPLDQAPRLANLVNLHVPQAGTGRMSEEDVAAHVAEVAGPALAALGYGGEQVSAGYTEKVDPFHEAR